MHLVDMKLLFRLELILLLSVTFRLRLVMRPLLISIFCWTDLSELAAGERATNVGMGDIESNCLIGYQVDRIGAGGTWTHASAKSSCQVFAQKNENQFVSGSKQKVNDVRMKEFVIIIQKQASGGSKLENTWKRDMSKSDETKAWQDSDSVS